MNKKNILLGMCMALSAAAHAQQKEGGITPQMLQQFEKMRPAKTADKALFNAIAANSIDDLARNHANAGKIDTHFSVETTKQSIHNQKSSGRCWMFTGLNVLRGNFAKTHKDSLTVEYSHDYLFFYDQLEKANLMLQGVINTARKKIEDPDVQFFFKNPINDGGTFCGVADLVDKYGLVPMSVVPETYSAENTSRMARIISSKLREYGLELRQMVSNGKRAVEIQRRKTEMLATVYHILCMTLGKPVESFRYTFTDKNGRPVGQEKTYTPLSFRDETVGRLLNGSFIMVMNDPRRAYYKTYEVDLDRHTYDGHNWKYLNLPMEGIASLAITSLKDGQKLYSSYDVGKQMDKKRGYLDTENFDYGALFGITFGMNKADRIATFDSGSTHAMTLSAVDLDASGAPKKWQVENSWGVEHGDKGYLTMSNRWFNEFTFRLVIDKKYVPQRLLQMEAQKPVMLTYDDPLFGTDD